MIGNVRRISWIPTALFVAAVPVLLITAAVTWAFNNPGLYRGGFEKYHVSQTTGIAPQDLDRVSADIRSYFNSGREPLDLRAPVYGEERELFNAKEVIHMRDVKGLLQGVYLAAAAAAFYVLALAGVVVARHRRRGVELLARRLLWGGVSTLALIMAVGLFALVGFDTLFLKFHELSFANDFWRGDSRTDFLVRLFPEGFWYDSTMWVAIRAAVGALIISALSSGCLLYLRRRPRTKPGAAAGPLKDAG